MLVSYEALVPVPVRDIRFICNGLMNFVVYATVG